MNWLRGFYEKFTEVTKRHPSIGRAENLTDIERALDDLRRSGQVRKKVLQIIAKSGEWTCDKWWDDLSDRLEPPVCVPSDLTLSREKRAAVTDLYARLKNIEVVSVVLRFWCPREFGIISPPVAWILSLPPGRYHIEYYMRYLDSLAKLAQEKGFDRFADVDMGLWSAAHLSDHWQYSELAKQMNEDPVFQKVRLENLVHGLGKHWEGRLDQQVLLAHTLLGRDPLTAAVIAGAAYEQLLIKIANLLKVDIPTDEWGHVKLWQLALSLRARPDLPRLGLRPGDFDFLKLCHLRNRAIHDRPQITEDGAGDLVGGVEGLWKKLETPNHGD